MNITMAQTIEERLINELENYMRQNPMHDTPHRKMFYMKYINDKIDDYKDNFLKEKDTLGMSEKEINSTMEYVSLKMLMKYQEI